jgi:hypothetical protein
MYPKLSKQIQCADETTIVVASSSADIELFFATGEYVGAVAIDRHAAIKLCWAIFYWWAVVQLAGIRPWIESRRARKWKATDEDRRAGL